MIQKADGSADAPPLPGGEGPGERFPEIHYYYKKTYGRLFAAVLPYENKQFF
jgi:hypothetical protein